jgi:hypothetical protein
VSHLDDLSSLDIENARWPSRDDATAALRPFLVEVGRVYAPFLIANARALASRASEVRCEIDGLPWVQQPFPYQGKCLKWLREAREALVPTDRKFVDSALESTGADTIFTAHI